MIDLITLEETLVSLINERKELNNARVKEAQKPKKLRNDRNLVEIHQMLLGINKKISDTQCKITEIKDKIRQSASVNLGPTF